MPTTFGQRLREARERQFISLRDVAREIDLTELMVDRFENDETEPSLTTITALCRALDVSADWLLGLLEDDDEG